MTAIADAGEASTPLTTMRRMGGRSAPRNSSARGLGSREMSAMAGGASEQLREGFEQLRVQVRKEFDQLRAGIEELRADEARRTRPRKKRKSS